LVARRERLSKKNHPVPLKGGVPSNFLGKGGEGALILEKKGEKNTFPISGFLFP